MKHDKDNGACIAKCKACQVKANELEIAMIKQGMLAKTIASALGNGPNVNGPMAHSHHCIHCDMVMPCDLAECPIPRDISKIHKCGERQDYNKRMSRLLDPGRCRWKCSGPCNHELVQPYHRPDEDQWEYMRPQVPEVATVAPFVRPMVMETAMQRSDRLQREKAKLNRYLDGFPQHLRELIKAQRTGK